MPNPNTLLYCATDKEIYDLFMASKRKMSEAGMLELARSRGVFCSTREGREELADFLSSITFDHEELSQLMCSREDGKRREKLSSEGFQVKASMEDLKQATEGLLVPGDNGEKITIRQDGGNRLVVELAYSEIDYSRSRLMQRREKKAEIELLLEDDQVLSRFPADPKARELLALIKSKLEEKKKCEIVSKFIEISEFKEASQRSEFFFSLIKGLAGLALKNVTNVKVDSFLEPMNDDEGEDEDSTIANAEVQGQMLGVIKQVTLQGESVISSPIFQELKRRGYFITSCIWQAKQELEPFSLVEFEAGFEDPQQGQGFKYNIRGEYHLSDGDYTKTKRPISPTDHRDYLKKIESAALQAVETLRNSDVVEEAK